MRLTDHEISKIAAACVLRATSAGAVLSAFEVDALGEVAARFLDLGELAPVTFAEWSMIDDAIEAMRSKAQPSFNVRVRINDAGYGRCRAGSVERLAS